ncbi:MAG: HNH endonuclease [Spirochaetes bacterium]|nr:HNH endonuclease [Spirochaetota bacterium]
MKAKKRKGKKWLLAIARAVAIELRSRIEGTPIRIRVPSRVTEMNTDGWSAVIGDLGKNRPRLEIWFDRFSGYDDRKLWVCFHSENRRQLTNITKLVEKKLVPVRTITENDIGENTQLSLAIRLLRSEFNLPILEKYSEGTTYYGLYDLTKSSSRLVSRRFIDHAIVFFESVARTLPYTTPEDYSREIYPQCENRKLVDSHLRRERSRLLATTRKNKDNYECQVCRLRFKDLYGKLGIDFAEAHHIVPLSQLRDNVQTRIEDLRTVCANCHRMLHRMDGKRDDITKLRAIVRKHRKRRC